MRRFSSPWGGGGREGEGEGGREGVRGGMEGRQGRQGGGGERNKTEVQIEKVAHLKHL